MLPQSSGPVTPLDNAEPHETGKKLKLWDAGFSDMTPESCTNSPFPDNVDQFLDGLEYDD